MNPIRFLLFTIAFILSGAATTGQENKEAPPLPYIEVTGHAEEKILPDEIYISIAIKERESGKDKTTVGQQENELKQALAQIGLPMENLVVSDAEADYIRVKWSKRNVVSQSEYELKVSTAQQVADVFKILDDLKIDNAHISRVDHSRIEEFKKELKIKAIQAAKEKADYLLEAIGQKTGAALIVHEIDKMHEPYDGITVRGSTSFPVGYEQPLQSKSLAVIEFQKINLESKIYVKFRIE